MQPLSDLGMLIPEDIPETIFREVAFSKETMVSMIVETKEKGISTARSSIHELSFSGILGIMKLHHEFAHHAVNTLEQSYLGLDGINMLRNNPFIVNTFTFHVSALHVLFEHICNAPRRTKDSMDVSQQRLFRALGHSVPVLVDYAGEMFRHYGML